MDLHGLDSMSHGFHEYIKQNTIFLGQKNIFFDPVCAGEPVSVSLDSKESTLSLSQLSPGSTYEVSVISILGLDESDPAKDAAMTRESCTASITLSIIMTEKMKLI